MLCGVLTKICSSTLQLLGIDTVTFLVICHMSNSAIIKYHYKERKVFRTWRHWTGILSLEKALENAFELCINFYSTS